MPFFATADGTARHTRALQGLLGIGNQRRRIAAACQPPRTTRTHRLRRMARNRGGVQQ